MGRSPQTGFSDHAKCCGTAFDKENSKRPFAVRYAKPHLKSAERHPTIFAIPSRSMVVNARKLLQETEIGSDILLNISTLRGMSFMDLARGRELFNAANDQISNAMNSVELAEGAGKLDHYARLHKVSMRRLIAVKRLSSGYIHRTFAMVHQRKFTP
jgi:hypothetical protein